MPMRILMIASEAVPFAKTGGLADVVSALSHALTRLGHTVDVVIPRYRGVSGDEPIGRVTVRSATAPRPAEISSVTDGRVRFVFVDQPEYFDREFVYGTGSGDY